MSTLVSRAQELTRQPIDPADDMAARRRALAEEALEQPTPALPAITGTALSPAFRAICGKPHTVAHRQRRLS